MTNIIIVEDDDKQREKLNKMLINNFKDIKIVASCSSVTDGVSKIKEHNPDLVFLDVEISDDSTGFDLLEKTRRFNYEVVFISGHRNYKDRAYNASAIHFIEKPYDLDDLIEAISKFNNQIANTSIVRRNVYSSNLENINNPLKKQLVLPVVGRPVIAISEIILCQAEDNYSLILLTKANSINQPIVKISKCLKWVENELLNNPTYFFRSHQSYLVNLYQIEKIKINNAGGEIKFYEDQTALISRDKKEGFLEFWKLFKGEV